MHLGYWWPFARTVWGSTIAILGVIAAFYYGPKKVLETFDWYMNRFVDYKVDDYLHDNVKTGAINFNGQMQWATAKPIADIVEATKLSEKRVRACLKRLKKNDRVREEVADWWKAKIPPFR